MTIHSRHRSRLRTFTLLLLAVLLLVRVGPFCEAPAMAGGAMPIGMAGCTDTPTAPTDKRTTDKSTPAACTMAACAALADDMSTRLAAPPVVAAVRLPLPRFAQHAGLEQAPATPPPRWV